MRAVESVRSRLLNMAGRLWSGSGAYQAADIDRIVSVVVPYVQAGQVQVANLTEAYFQQAGARAGVEFGFVTGGRGIPAVDVYRRPAVTTYTALSMGKPMALAVTEGGQRLASLVSTDLQMAKVRQAQRSLESAGFGAYQRVLSGAENCALCVVASTQRYHTGDLMPIHPGCDCGVEALPSGVDPADQIIDSDLLELTHDAIDSRLGTDRGARDLGLGKVTSQGKPVSDYTDLIITREHSEYGPTLSWRDHKFTSAADIKSLSQSV